MLPHLGEVLGDNLRNGVASGPIFHAGGQPCLGIHITADRCLLRFGGGAIIQIGRIACMSGAAIGKQLYKMDLLGDHSLSTIVQNHTVLNTVFDIEQQTGLVAVVAVIYEHSASLEQIGVSLPRQVNGGLQQRMAGTNQFGGRQSGKITSALVKADSLVPLQDRLAKAHLHIPIAHGEGHGGDLVPAGFPRAYLPTYRAESLYKKGFDKMRLQLVGFDSLHILPDGHDPVNIHGVLGESTFFQKLLQSLAVHGIVHNLPQSGTNLGIIAVANGFDQQIPQVAIIEGHLA